MPNNEVRPPALVNGPLVQGWAAPVATSRCWGEAPTPSTGRITREVM